MNNNCGNDTHVSEWHKHNTAPGAACTGYTSVQAPSARRPHLSFLIISLHLCHPCVCRLLTQSCCRGAFTSISAHWSPVSVRSNARTAGWRLAPQTNDPLSLPRASLMDFTGGSRIHDLSPLRGSPWELCCLYVLLVRLKLSVSDQTC